MATIKITRTSEYINRFRNYTLYIDGREAGKIASGETKAFEVTPGRHTFHSEIDWCSSPEKEVHVAENEMKEIKVSGFKQANWLMPIAVAFLLLDIILRVSIGFGYLFYLIVPMFLLLVYNMSFGRKKYLTLQEVTGPRQNSIQFN